jgi:adenylate kinase
LGLVKCANCGQFERRNAWICAKCQANLPGGIVFVTGISGSGVGEYVQNIAREAERHGHSVQQHGVGDLMRQFAQEDDPDVRWDRILDADDKSLRHLRARAFDRVARALTESPDSLHLVSLHLSFRWRAYLTKGLEPHILNEFQPYVRCFVNIIEDLAKIHERLRATSWGDRKILELLVWRDEELFLTDMFANTCGRVSSFAVARGEPHSEVERLIWHPDIKKVYLSFPITAILEDKAAQQEITAIRDRIREFLIVFDPYACRDYDMTYQREEMAALRREVGEATTERDYRFIDQADAVVVYYPKKVPSKGVDAEMNHARRTGKPIFLYSPEHPGGGPFAVPERYFQSNPDEFVRLLRRETSDQIGV